MEIKDLEILMDEIVPLLKKQYPVGWEKKKKPDWQDFHPTYKQAIHNRDRIRYHAEIGGFPEDLFINRAPNQTDQEYQYIKANYKQTTLPVYMDYHQTITRCFNDGNYDLIYDQTEENDDDSLQSYLEKDIRIFDSLESYMKSAIVHLKALDSEGVICIKPDNIQYIQNPESEDENDIILDTSELLTPQPFFYRCDQVLKKQFDDYYLILLDEKSLVDYGNKNTKMGFVLEMYDKEKITRITQVGKYVDFEFVYQEYFYHDWQRCPVIEMKGVPQLIDNNVLWQSHFLYACDNLDLALMNAQYLQASIAKVCFPMTVMLGDDCSYSETDSASGQILTCNNGKIFIPSLDGSEQRMKTCPSCNGSSVAGRLTSMGTLYLRKSDWRGPGDSPKDALYHVGPPVDSLEFVFDNVENNTLKARKILHLYDSNSQVKTQDPTATFMAIDMKAMYAFIKPISNQLFEIWEFMMDAIGWQRYGKDYKKPTLHYPDTFDYNTEADYLYQISEAQKAGLPPFVIHSIIERYLSTLYYNQKEVAAAFRLIIETDRLLTISQNDINIGLTRNAVQVWEKVLHDSAFVFVKQLMRDESFMELDFEDQQQALIELAKKTVPEASQASSPDAVIKSILNPQGVKAA